MKGCPIGECGGTRSDSEVMCRTHWGLVSKETRDRVWRAYKADPYSTEHLDAIRDARAEAAS